MLSTKITPCRGWMFVICLNLIMVYQMKNQASIKFYGWTSEMLKLSVTDLFRKEFNLSLSEAKNYTDKLLDGESFTLIVFENADADMLLKKFRTAGVLCSFESL
jgi:hypothetical protein